MLCDYLFPTLASHCDGGTQEGPFQNEGTVHHPVSFVFVQIDGETAPRVLQ